MKLRYEKNIRILNDLMGYCHFLGANSFTVGFELRGAQSTISIDAGIAHMPQENIDHLRRILNMPRQPEIEQNYWNLSGEEEIDDELSLAGMMVDTAEVNYQNGRLYIVARRQEQSVEE